MPETVRIDVSQTIWTDIVGDVVSGLVTNNSGHSIRYRWSDSQPASNDGGSPGDMQATGTWVEDI